MNESTNLDAMAQISTDLDDLDNLFEFGDIDLNNIPDTHGFDTQMQHSHPGTQPNTPFQDMTQPPPMSGTSAHDFGGHDQYAMSQAMGQSHQQQQFIGQHDPQMQTTLPFTTDSMYQPSIQHMYSQNQPYQIPPQHGYPQTQHVVPPTPNSYEMHGLHGRFMDRPQQQQQQQQQQLDPQQQAILAQRYALRKEEIAFTPMVSPAVTPQYHMLPEFTTPGAYFSPLTSPMLHAQNQQHQQQVQLQHQQQGYATNPSTAPSSNTNSPVDPSMDVEMGGGRTHRASAETQPRKSGRRKIATAKGAGAAGSRTNQNSAQKAQKRKSTAPGQPNQQAGQDDDIALRAAKTLPSNLRMPAHQDSSEAESISPEPLSESLMGPPPRPGASQSPAIVGKQEHQASAVAAAATPKSLLTMRTAQQPINGQQDDATVGAQDLGGLDDLALPEAANAPSSTASLAQIDTEIAMQDDDTPRISARKTPKLGPLSTPSSARPGSAIQSPTVASPMSATTPSAILRDKKDGKAGRGSKKRGSMSTSGSKMVSPALVPKISPSIKPLLPEGTTLNTATQAMLLASKSNYQNLLEGNRLPGVNYPDSLSTGLTSKRTSHKVAEQGRRNRINEALKEMQALIPKSSPTGKPSLNSAHSHPGDESGSPPSADANGGDEDKPAADGSTSPSSTLNAQQQQAKDAEAVAKSNSSKAATVELANEYIRKMQAEQASQRERIVQLEREKEELVRRLEGKGEGEGEEG